jgi:hypothetical protein
MSFASMHNDYLDPDRHCHDVEEAEYEEETLAIKQALKASDTGRWDYDKIDACLTGKDADLEPWGQQGIEVVSVDDIYVHCLARFGKTFAGTDVCLNTPTDISDDDEDWLDMARDRYLDAANEVVSGCGLAGEWTGDDWYMSEAMMFETEWKRDPEGEIDYKATAVAIVEDFSEMMKPVEDELILAGKILDMLAGWKTIDPETKEVVRCPEGQPGPEAAWNQGMLND